MDSVLVVHSRPRVVNMLATHLPTSNNLSSALCLLAPRDGPSDVTKDAFRP